MIDGANGDCCACTIPAQENTNFVANALVNWLRVKNGDHRAVISKHLIRPKEECKS
jgi:hypothetical protein